MFLYNKNMLNANIDLNLALSFRKEIEESNYKFMYNSLLDNRIFHDTWFDGSSINYTMGVEFSKEDILIFEFLMLGSSIERIVLQEKLGDKSIEFLIKTNFAIEKNNILYSNGYSIVVINNIFLIVSTPNEYIKDEKVKKSISKYADIYIGQDSLSMMSMISGKKFFNVLDLCAGSGIQGFNICSGTSSKLTSVEINDNAYAALVINSKVNNVNNITLLGDLYKNIVEERFDCIVSNPPYVPTPKGLEFPMCGDGGEDGLQIAKRIIEGYDKYLAYGGYAYMVLECIGDDDKPYIIDMYRNILKEGVLNVRILAITPIELQIKYSVDLYQYLCGDICYDDIYNKFKNIFKKNKAVKMYSIVIEYIKIKKPLKINKIGYYNIPYEKEYKIISENIMDTKNLEYISIGNTDDEKIYINKDIYSKICEGSSIGKLIKEIGLERYNELFNLIYILRSRNDICFKEDCNL